MKKFGNLYFRFIYNLSFRAFFSCKHELRQKVKTKQESLRRKGTYTHTPVEQDVV